MPIPPPAQRTRVGFSMLVLLFVFLSGCSATGDGEDDSSGPNLETLPTVTTIGPVDHLPSSENAEETHVLGKSEDLRYLYVGLDGSDRDPGTAPTLPLRTVAEAAERLNGVGGTIELLAGQYDSQDVSHIRGTALNPIIIRSRDRQAILSSTTYEEGAGLTIANSEHIVVDGLVFRSSLWGIQVYASKNITIVDNQLTDIGQEAIHLKSASSFVDVIDNEISHTGLRPGSDRNGIPYSNYGEGIYVGCGSCEADKVHDIRIVGNDISFTTAEAIDLKPHTYNLLVEANHIHDVKTATSGAVVLGIGVKDQRDPNAVIRNNMIWNISRTSRWKDGNAISLSAAASVYNNVIWNTEHRGIWVDSNFVNRDARTVHIFHNTVVNSGLAGIQVSQGGNDSLAIVEANIGVDIPGNLLSDPSWFVDASAKDFRLDAAVPAIDAAKSGLVGYDIQGFPRPQGSSADVGAYEFGSPAPTQALPTRQAVPEPFASPASSVAPATATVPKATTSPSASPIPTPVSGQAEVPVPSLVRPGVPHQPQLSTAAVDSRFENDSLSVDGSSIESPDEAAIAASPSVAAQSTTMPQPAQDGQADKDDQDVRESQPAPERAIGLSDQQIERPQTAESTTSKVEGIPSELAYRDVITNPTEQIPGDNRFPSQWLLLAGIAALALGIAGATRRKRSDQSV